MKQKEYVAPIIEEFEIKVEKGFAESIGGENDIEW